MKVVISGTVGVGKTTIVSLLEQELKNRRKNLKICFELQTNNPFLSFYYNDRVNWAFLTQIDFLLQRFKQLIETHNAKVNLEQFLVYDRHFLDDFVFINTNSILKNMSTTQLKIYQIISNYMLKLISTQKPNYFFLIKADYSAVLNRIKIRNRPEEIVVDEQYWKDLYFHYYENPEIQTYFKNNTKFFKIIDSTNLTPDQIVNKIIKSIF